jgi:TPR repeat protein
MTYGEWTPDRIEELAKGACEAGDAWQCFWLGQNTEDGSAWDPKLDASRTAAPFYERACRLGDGEGCEALADLLRSGALGAADPARLAALDTRAIPLLDAMCSGGGIGACTVLAEMLDEGEGVTVDHERAATLRERACEADLTNACNGVAVRLLEKGPRHDPAKAATLLRRSCDGKQRNGLLHFNPVACSNLGVLLRDGDGVPRDLAGAARAFDHGCDGGNKVACAELAKAYESGQGVPRDGRRAAQLRARGR